MERLVQGNVRRMAMKYKTVWLVEEVYPYSKKRKLISQHDNERDAIDIAYAWNCNTQPESSDYSVRRLDNVPIIGSK